MYIVHMYIHVWYMCAFNVHACTFCICVGRAIKNLSSFTCDNTVQTAFLVQHPSRMWGRSPPGAAFSYYVEVYGHIITCYTNDLIRNLHMARLLEMNVYWLLVNTGISCALHINNGKKRILTAHFIHVHVCIENAYY